MWYFGLCPAFFIIMHCSLVRTITIPCNNERAIVWSHRPDVIGTMHDSMYWTKRVYYRPNVAVPAPLAFVYGSQLIRTLMGMNRDTSTACTFTTIVTDNQNTLNFYRTMYEVDNKRAVFRTLPEIRKCNVINTLHYGTQFGSVTISDLMPVTFALIHQDSSHKFRIYQTCDKEILWIQLQNSEMISQDPMHTAFMGQAELMVPSFHLEQYEKLDILGNAFPFQFNELQAAQILNSL